VPEDGISLFRDVVRQHRRAWARPPGATSPLSNSLPPRAIRWLMSQRRCASTAPSPPALDVCPTGRAVFRTEFRHGGGPGRRVQRLRLLRARLPVRVIARRGGRRGRRTSARCATTGWEPGWSPACRERPAPTQVDPVRPAWTSCASGPGSGSTTCTRPARIRRGLYLDGPGRTGSAAAGRSSCSLDEARGVRPAAGPGGHHPGPCPAMWKNVAHRPRPGWAGAAVALGVGQAPVTSPVRFAAGRRRGAERGHGGRDAPSSASYYGRPVIKEPCVARRRTWAGYLFFGGLAGLASPRVAGGQGPARTCPATASWAPGWPS